MIAAEAHYQEINRHPVEQEEPPDSQNHERGPPQPRDDQEANRHEERREEQHGLGREEPQKTHAIPQGQGKTIPSHDCLMVVPLEEYGKHQ